MRTIILGLVHPDLCDGVSWRGYISFRRKNVTAHAYNFRLTVALHASGIHTAVSEVRVKSAMPQRHVLAHPVDLVLCREHVVKAWINSTAALRVAGVEAVAYAISARAAGREAPSAGYSRVQQQVHWL